MNKSEIRDLALANGFKLKEQADGNMDLNPYVYRFASALMADAGRAGFVAGAMEWGGIGFAATVEADADEYAEKIKQGGTA
jgi:hypothetical protein